MKTRNYLIVVELKVRILVPNLLDIHCRSNHDTSRDYVEIGYHLKNIWMNESLGHLEVHLIVEAQAHDIGKRLALIALNLLVEAVEFAF